MGHFWWPAVMSPVAVMTQRAAPWHPVRLTSRWRFSSRALPWQIPGLFVLVSNQTLTSSWHRLH